ncbi:hypothetical protein BESB_046270 [Besnoitia besnoiti]|uniref:Uncharacterized protein n=1 Tax=Besnoitia besnoiti TaxID=94643 RepID=A0A2A9MEL6_BESBE|nr:hypothetical protein BESB_046270 [Besnoitia besnoiti]PFH36435.1 hypothetical protein BESB_046270 [Besnoitia besnoiti]
MARVFKLLQLAVFCCLGWHADVRNGTTLELREGDELPYMKGQKEEMRSSQTGYSHPRLLEYIVPPDLFKGAFRRFQVTPTRGEKIRIVDESGKMRLEPSASLGDNTLTTVFPVEGRLCNLEKNVSLQSLFERYTQNKTRRFWREKVERRHTVFELSLPVFDPRKCPPRLHEPAIEFCALLTAGSPSVLEQAKRLGFAATALPDSLLVRVTWNAV